MKTASLTKIACGLIAASAFAVLQASASPLFTGDINFLGSATLNKAIPNATTITKVTATVDGTSTTGDYSAVPGGTAVTFSTPLNFVTLETALPSTVTPWWTFTVAGKTYNFAIDGSVTVTQTKVGANSQLDIDGSGTAWATGFAANDNTSFQLSIGKSGGSTLHFGDSTSAPGVPDSGTTALLIGLGLAGVGIGMVAQRRKLAKSAA